MNLVWIVSSLHWLLILATAFGQDVDSSEQQTCTWDDNREVCRQEEEDIGSGAAADIRDKHLQPIKFTLDSNDGNKEETVAEEVAPDVNVKVGMLASSESEEEEQPKVIARMERRTVSRVNMS